MPPQLSIATEICFLLDYIVRNLFKRSSPSATPATLNILIIIFASQSFLRRDPHAGLSEALLEVLHETGQRRLLGRQSFLVTLSSEISVDRTFY